MNNKLQQYFPMIRNREEILKSIQNRKELQSIFSGWTKTQQEEFLDFCSGTRGVKMLYDCFAKEILNPETVPERLNELLSLLLGKQLELLQKFLFIPLDIFLEKHHNKHIENRLDAWLMFLSSDDPEDIISVMESYPDFKAMYEQVYEICCNIERVMEMFSEELRILDRNTVRYMMDEMQSEIDKQKAELAELEQEIGQKKERLSQQSEQISQQSEQISQQSEQISQQSEQISQQSEQISQQSEQINQQILQLLAKNNEIQEKDQQLQAALKKIAELEGKGA